MTVISDAEHGLFIEKNGTVYRYDDKEQAFVEVPFEGEITPQLGSGDDPKDDR